MKTLKEKLQEFSAEDQEHIHAMAAEIVAEELSLRQLREALNLTQSELADLLEIRQDNVSRLEQRGDMRVSTLRSVVTAMGGRLSIRADFPDRTVSLTL